MEKRGKWLRRKDNVIACTSNRHFYTYITREERNHYLQVIELLFCMVRIDSQLAIFIVRFMMNCFLSKFSKLIKNLGLYL